MSDQPKRPNRKGEIDWSPIRSAYENEGVTNVSELSRRFKVTRESIIRHRDNDKWRDAAQMSDKVSANVIDIATRRAVENGVVDRITEALNANIESVLSAQPRLLAKLTEYAEKLIDKGINGELLLGKVSGEHEAFNAILSGASRLFRDGRLVAGVPSDEASTSDHTKQTGLTIKRERLEPVKIPVDEKGRKISA
jgi:hypothetical protein